MTRQTANNIALKRKAGHTRDGGAGERNEVLFLRGRFGLAPAAAG
jgi:hypothetical protein